MRDDRIEEPEYVGVFDEPPYLSPEHLMVHAIVEPANIELEEQLEYLRDQRSRTRARLVELSAKK